MGDSVSGARRRRSRGPAIAVSLALAVCLLVTVGVVALVGRVSTALNEWEPPTATSVDPSDGTIATPPHDELTGPPEHTGVAARTDDATGEPGEAGADEQSRPAPGPQRPDDTWLDEVSDGTGIPRRVLEGYASAQLVLDEEQAECGMSWPTLAGIGFIESRHGTYAGGEVGSDGNTTVDVIGIALDGTNNTRAIPDTEGGELDGDTEWDRAVGPMQFIPVTWAKWGESLEGDGDPDPHNIDDAALSSARYLCEDGRDLSTTEDWEDAIFEYNRSDSYRDDVLAYAHAYADAS
ncbi:lytic transglycosylase domain-containing protein [Nocardiopsis sp. JB363]|uniref:lytic transglycosylase domain-containing protein n=1 Tax=Nocardiopsis sp. JB363 TaxID=1434837 RepID=UPI000979E6A3|nr:lytic transglycosylase domain-containing protein [Nocardiopsis sp. JB363]SIO84763.1 similar to Membrane-bound lytic murein transglycosylase B [Nocardiopsis sp. JB363]